MDTDCQPLISHGISIYLAFRLFSFQYIGLSWEEMNLLVPQARGIVIRERTCALEIIEKNLWWYWNIKYKL